MDYVNYFGMREAPFNLLPNSRFFFEGSSHRRAFSYLTFGLNKAEGFVVITGEIGAGKTTIIDLLTKQLSSTRVRVAKIAATLFEADDFLRMIANAFQVETEGRDKASVYHALETTLRDAVRARQQPLLLIDEAQGMRHSAFEELRMLSNLQYHDRSLLQIFLLGHPELRTLLARPEHDQLRQRIIARYHLTALKEEEIRDYVLHRLKVAGWQGIPQITDDCFSLVFRETEGVPRKINKLSDRALWFAFLEEKNEITRDHIASVIEDMKAEDFLSFQVTIEDVPEVEAPFSVNDLMRPKEQEPRPDTNIMGWHGVSGNE